MQMRKKSSVFTEQGIALLLSVLKSRQTIRVSIQIIRTFTKLREMIISTLNYGKDWMDLSGNMTNGFNP